MNYTICLDPSSLSSTPSGNGFLIYTDVDNFTTPVASVPGLLLFPPPTGNCPYSLSGIPNGATQLLIVDNCQFSEAGPPPAANTLTGECCYALIDIDSSLCNDFCEDCDIEFNVYATSTTGSIIAGNLISSCGEVTDYTIGWYLNGDYSSPVYISGYGTQFTYQLTHPLTASAAPLVAAGNWEGIIHDLIINGTQYSTVSGSGIGTNIPFTSCFGTTVATPFKCDNGSFPLPYSHQKTFTAVSNGVPPAPSTFTYALSSSTNYFAYLFEGQQAWDELEIKYISGNPNGTTNPALYSQPIYLEKIRVGFNAPISSTSPLWTLAPGGAPSTYPVNASYQSNFRRTITLTGLETSSIPNSPDRLEITVTPNTVNFTTNWNLYMQCLEDFDCSNCTLDNDPPFKIYQINLDRPTGNPCPQQRLLVAASGCFENGTNSDLFGYNSIGSSAISYVQTNNAFSPQNFIIPNGYVQLDDTVTCTNWFGGTNNVCLPSTPNTITFEKNNNFSNGIASTGQTLGQIKFTFNNVNDFTFYQNKINAIESVLTNLVGPLTTDCTSPQYYSGYSLSIPFQAANNSCGDNTTTFTYYIHRTAYPNIVYFADPANNNWEITIPMPECNDCLSFSGCTNCTNTIYGYPAILGVFNSSSYADNTNLVSYSNNFAAKYSDPFSQVYFTTSSFGASTFYSSSLTYYSAQGINQYSMVTVPFIPDALNSGSWVNLFSLSGSACPDWFTKFSSSIHYPNHTGPIYNAFYYDISSVFPNLSESITFTGNDDFNLYTRVIDNSGALQASPLLIYSYSQSVATVHQPSFFVGGSPTLTIDPF